MTTSSFSQSSYPKRILWENDTVLAITKDQLISVNRSLNDFTHLEKAYQNLQMDLSLSDSLLTYWKAIAYREDSIARLNEKRFMSAHKLSVRLSEDLYKEKVKGRNRAIGVGVGGGVLGIILGVLLSINN